MTRQEENILKALPKSQYLCSNGKPVLQVVDGKVYNLDGTPAQTILDEGQDIYSAMKLSTM